MTRATRLLSWAVSACLLAVQAGADAPITIRTPQAGGYILRQLPGHGAVTAIPAEFAGPEGRVTVDRQALGADGQLAIDNQRTGRTALVAATKLPQTAAPLVLGAADFRYVRELRIIATYRDKPVRTARVTVSDSRGGQHTQAIDPSAKGVAIFEDLPVGKARVTVAFGPGWSMAQDLLLDPTQQSPVPIVRMVLAGPTSSDQPEFPTVSGATAPATPPPAPTRSSSPVTAIAGLVLGLCVSGGIIYGLYRWAISGNMATTLKGIGIETEGPQAAQETAGPWQPPAGPPPVVADPSLCPYCGTRREPDGSCACVVGQAPPTALSPGTPRIVGIAGQYAGIAFDLPTSSSVTIGRDPSCTVPLPDDATVSRSHARITFIGNGMSIEDSGSSNGVLVNGIRISEPRSLVAGDEVQVGSTRFRVEA